MEAENHPSIPYFRLVGHDEDYFAQRGADIREIGLTLASGEVSSTYGGRFIAKRVFTAGYERRRVYYPHKELEVVYAVEEWGIAVITVIVRFGFWRDAE